ncbi:hypothetical protein, partial [Klebsiella michiganensis]|uniref:hypothetical protein n=1 Tax=Klebsiella michiganensis TaxID=1134687 RepID=UPI00311F7E7E
MKDNVASATARRASEASHPARPTNVKKRPKGAFLLSAISSKITTIRNTLMLRYSTVALRLPWLQLAQASRYCERLQPFLVADTFSGSRMTGTPTTALSGAVVFSQGTLLR